MVARALAWGMSIDTPPADEVDHCRAPACGLCGASTDPTGRLLAWYATDGVAIPALVAEDGLLALCPGCATDVRELTDAWDEIGQPTVGPKRSIAESYGTAADECSFCDDELADDSPSLGLEAWAPGHRAGLDPNDHTHHALCDTCVPVFGEFLRGVSDDA